MSAVPQEEDGVAECRYEAIAGTSKAGSKFLEIIPVFSNAEEDVLISEFEQLLCTPPLHPALEEIVAMDVEADLEDIRKPISQTPVTPETIEQLIYDFSNSQVLRCIVGKQEQSHLAVYLRRAELRRYFFFQKYLMRCLHCG